MNDTSSIVRVLRDRFQSGETKSYEFRYEQLSRLEDAIRKSEGDIQQALQQDLNKSPFESFETEIGIVLSEIREAKKNLRKWMRPRCVKTPLSCFPANSKIYMEPYGVVLIMAPWNYPFQLTMAPLVGAIAAGNCALLKPSNYSEHTSDAIKKLVDCCFEDDYVSVVLGGREANQDLLKEEFDYIFFTGGTTVGKFVMESASNFLTPVTLELGGKSPCIVDETADIKMAAKRIAWGKCVNAGQTCIAPDYLFAHSAIKEELLREIEKSIASFFHNDPIGDGTYPKIINEKHFDRLNDLIQRSGTVRYGGKTDRKTLKIEPTILEHVTFESPVMQEEIFGPLLPVLEFDNIETVKEEINTRSKPLAFYYFTTDKSRERYMLEHISFGGGCINETLMHFASSHLPFGGVGMSGMGKYHGKYSFDTFSHEKGVLKKANWYEPPVRYPPYSDKNEKWIRRFLK